MKIQYKLKVLFSPTCFILTKNSLPHTPFPAKDYLWIAMSVSRSPITFLALVLYILLEPSYGPFQDILFREKEAEVVREKHNFFIFALVIEQSILWRLRLRCISIESHTNTDDLLFTQGLHFVFIPPRPAVCVSGDAYSLFKLGDNPLSHLPKLNENLQIIQNRNGWNIPMNHGKLIGVYLVLPSKMLYIQSLLRSIKQMKMYTISIFNNYHWIQ